ncbi:MAG: hypothetical protein KDK90_26775, partial [Leptospiraceae bacterium]|nr:hypothetical protein [Leptospiraceae bacterium]
FVLHENAKQKGCIHEIKPDDILILKYKHEFIGYGRSTSSLKQIGEGWSYQVDVNMWEIIFINMEFKMHNKKVQHMML